MDTIKKNPGKSRKDQRKDQKIHKSRLIIRNLSFKTTENDIREAFKTFGTIVDVNMPKKDDGQFRGFAFVAFDNIGSSLKAIKNLNGKKICDRTVAVDFSVDKTTYDKAMDEKKKNAPPESENQAKSKPKPTKKTEKDVNNNSVKTLTKKKPKVSKEAKKKKQKEDEKMDVDLNGNEDSHEEEEEDGEMDVDVDENDDSNEEEDDEMDVDLDESDMKTNDITKKPRNKSKKDDVSEGRTLFVRNLDLDTTEESVGELFKQFGDIVYCKICMNPYTEKSKGTAFVLFKSKESAEKCLKEAQNSQSAMFYLDGQQLLVTLALERNRLYALEEEKRNKYKDKRNLYLAKEGLIYPKSPAAIGVSQSDLKRRVELEEKKRKLLQNLHYFISDKRLCVHNVPEDYNDKKLHDLFIAAADDPTAKITWSRVMRNRSKANNKFGNSKGFGFIEFAEHWHALKALRFLNNNPDVWTPERRPIVEFAVENKVAVNIKRYREIAYEKKKNEIQNKTNNEEQNVASGEGEEKKKKKNKGRKKSRNERIAGQKARKAAETILSNSDNATQNEDKNNGDLEYSGVQSKPSAGKVIIPKLNRKLNTVKEDLLKNKRLLKKDKRKAENKKRHLIKLEKRKAKQIVANESASKRYREEEDVGIDSHFHKRKRIFLDSK